MDWFKGKITGKPHIQWEHLWFPVKIFPNKPTQSIDEISIFVVKSLVLCW